MVDTEQIDRARRVVTAYLRGELTPDRNPEYFDDDVVMFAVARLDVHDTEWLLEQVASGEWPYGLRSQIAALMRSHAEEGRAILRDEDPNEQ
ncbi:hypothetical protein [Nocardia sp. N2S4-5]|uniref:hypothetical protein n=1 Tax=Nocardia sp. N2S4-5 TaxID=3351565 RepID=UPI0037D8A716